MNEFTNPFKERLLSLAESLTYIANSPSTDQGWVKDIRTWRDGGQYTITINFFEQDL